MALIRCPDCEREVSSRARACPQCAYPVENLTSFSDAILQNDIDLLRDLLRAGFNANEAKEEGLTPLMLAIREGNFSATKLLVQHGAELNPRDANGKTALMHAISKGHEDLAEFLIEKGAEPAIKNEFHTATLASEKEDSDPEKFSGDSGVRETKQKQKHAAKPKAVAPISAIPVDDEIPNGDIDDPSTTTGTSKMQPPPVPEHLKIGPPPLPDEHKASARQPIRFIDDTVPVVEDEKYPGPGLICRTCKGSIAAEDIWCAHCKAPIIRRYCGGCHELIPDNAALCPYCNSAKLHRFRYIRHLEQFVAGAAVLGVLLFIFSIYGPNEGTSYAEKLAQKRSQQQEQTEIAAEEKSKKQSQAQAQRSGNTKTTNPAVVRVVPRETATEESVVQARGKSEDSGERIPTVERIEAVPQPSESDKPVEVAQQAPEAEASSKTRESSSDEPKRAASELPTGEGETRPTVDVARQLNEHGFRLMKSGRYAEAIPVLAQAVRSFPPGQKNLTYAYALYNLGRSLRLVGRPDLAVPILEERMKFANQRHIVARELEIAKEQLSGGEPVNRVEYE